MSIDYNTQFNEQMKSEYYRQIEVDTFPKKTSAHEQAKRKLISDSATHNALTHSRNFRSEKRNMINSIDLMRKSKQDNEAKMKISYSKQEAEALKCEAQWVQLKCLQCESLKAEQGKRFKELQMVYEEELTEEKEKFIMMEKKYLLKESENIKLQTQLERLDEMFVEMEGEHRSLKANYEAVESSLKGLEVEHDKLQEQTKTQQEKIENLHHFLKLYVEQTKIIINWAHLFEQIQEELPTLIHVIKEDLLIRKMDFQITLKQAATFERLNFSEIASNKEEASGFLGDDSGCETFMKYLKQEPKLRAFNPQTSTKKSHSLIDSFSNKENIDFLNGISIKSLLSSNVKDKKSKQKHEAMNDECLRLLLLQAKAIESNLDSKAETVKMSGMIEDFSQERSVFC